MFRYFSCELNLLSIQRKLPQKFNWELELDVNPIQFNVNLIKSLIELDVNPTQFNVNLIKSSIELDINLSWNALENRKLPLRAHIFHLPTYITQAYLPILDIFSSILGFNFTFTHPPINQFWTSITVTESTISALANLTSKIFWSSRIIFQTRQVYNQSGWSLDPC